MAIGTGVLFVPAWFFEHIVDFPPFNHHYPGDVGAFVLPLGMALLVAARSPCRYLALIGLTAGASLLHALNHLYDAVTGHGVAHWIVDSIPLLVLGVLLAMVYVGLTLRHR